MRMNYIQKLKAFFSGDEAERFVEHFTKKTFLAPWVFRSPKFVADGKEFTDVAVLFRETLILIQVKGNQFDPRNPQRYLAEAKGRHEQLKGAERVVLGKHLSVRFKNKYFSFETDFKNIKKIYLISVSTGRGEMEMASGRSDIDYSKVNYEEVRKYLGFFDPTTKIHSFTASELVFASEHVDTLKDFFWYLEFERKFFTNDFTPSKEGQSILPIVDANREDLIAIYILTYYWDEELNKTGNINLNKILGKNIDLKKADMIVYAGTDTHKHLKDDKTYIKIEKEKKISYFWDGLIEHALSEYSNARKLVGGTQELQPADIADIKGVVEELSFTSRLERVYFSEKIKETDDKNLNVRNMLSLNKDAETIFSYAKIDYDEFPSGKEQESRVNQRLYGVWCRIKFGENLKPYKDKIKKALLIVRHTFKGKFSITFVFSTEVSVEKNMCEKMGFLGTPIWKKG